MPLPARLGAALALCALAAPAFAVNTMFLNNAPISRMTKEDIDLFYAAVNRVLNDGAAGVAVDWQNAKTGAKGKLTPLATHPGRSGPCRDLRVQNQAGGLVSNNVFLMCKTAEGEWKMQLE